MVEYESKEDYIVKSLTFLTERHKSVVEERKGLKAEMEELQEDIRIIKCGRLQGAATQAFNHLSMNYSQLGTDLKAIRQDQKWVKEVWEALKLLRVLQKK